MRTEATGFGARGAALLAALLVFGAAATAARAFPMPRPGLEATISGGRSSYPEDGFGSDLLHDKVAAGYGVGGTLAWKPAGPLSVETGLRYALDTERRDLSFVFTGGSAWEIVQRTRLHRLGVPVRMLFALPFVRGLSVEAGAETQYLLLARRDDEQHGNGLIIFARTPGDRIAAPAAIIFEDYTGQNDITSLYPRWNLAVTGGLGWAFPVGRVSAEVRARYLHGVSDQTKTPYAKDYSRVGELGLAVRW